MEGGLIMAEPRFADYVNLIHNLFDQFMRHHQDVAKRESRVYYTHKILIVFFVMMQFRRIMHFKTQHRWLQTHPEERAHLGFPEIPHRTTLSRRYKTLYQFLQHFIAFIGDYVESLDAPFRHDRLFEDKSLFKAHGPVWHQSDRNQGRIPEHLHHLDTDATWSKSGYHGWVYGYGLHITSNHAAFPQLVQVDTACVSEKQVITDKEPVVLTSIQPDTVTTDNSYFSATRVRTWAKQGVALITPACKWVNGRYAQAYHQFLRQPAQVRLFQLRKTTVEPLFDLIAKIIGATGKQKQLVIQRQANVSTCLTLATFTIQIAMIVNNIWGLPLRHIGTMHSVFS
jgi:hypothetical protein